MLKAKLSGRWGNSPEWTATPALEFLKRWMILSAIIHLLAAVFSSGFYQYDEHFQVLEFLSYLQGRSSGSELPWEFQNQIRSWTQPMAYFGLSKILFQIGVTSPFT